MLGRLRQQGGAMILTVPNVVATQMGWQVGNELDIQMQGESVILKSVKRKPKGRKSLQQLLDGIESQEIAELNASVAEFSESVPQGREMW